MPQYEYKTVTLPFQLGLFKQGLPDVQATLNAEGLEGWRFRQMVVPASVGGQSDCMLAILERPLTGRA